MTEKPDNIRLCKKGDESALFDFAMSAYEDNALFPVNEKKVTNFIDCAVRGTHPIFIGIIDAVDSAAIAASVALEYMNDWYSDVWYLGDKWNFIVPEYRKGNSYSNDLLNFAKWISEQCERPLGMGILTEKRLEPKAALYRRKFTQMGAYFMYNYVPEIRARH